MEYTVVIERTPNNFSAYVPDLPGCVSTGATIEETRQNIAQAIRLHIDGMRADGQLVPEPAALALQIAV